MTAATSGDYRRSGGPVPPGWWFSARGANRHTDGLDTARLAVQNF
jgi:hypothetical protein